MKPVMLPRRAALLFALLPALLAPLACAEATRIEGSGGSGGGAGTAGGGAGTTTTTGTGGSGGACGNGFLDPGETCDPPSSCPTSCDDGDACTQDIAQGAAATCTFACLHPAVTGCAADGCCVAACGLADPDCQGCGNGIVEGDEECDDGNADNTDACLSTCVAATCGDGFLHAGVEQCDDGNTVGGDGCSATCTLGGTTFGPQHTFVGMTSSFYVTQFGCSNSNGNAAGDALWFCQHFYNASCTVMPGYMTATSVTSLQMHSGTNCNNPDPNGTPIPNTTCIGGPCKIGNYSTGLGGLTNLVCSCP